MISVGIGVSSMFFLGIAGVSGGGTAPPAKPTLTSPADSSTLFVGESITLSGTTTDSPTSVSWVATPSGGGAETVIGTDSSAPYSQAYTVALAAGNWDIVMRATGPGGSTDSDPAAVTVGAPASFADTIYWLDVDHLTHTGDGTEITAATDQGAGTANAIGVSAGGGPTYRATAWVGHPCIEVGANKALVSGSTPAVVSFLNGSASASKEFTVITCWMPRHHLQTIPWSFAKSTTSSRHVTGTCLSNQYKPSIYGGTAAGAQTTIGAGAYWDHQVPAIASWRRSGGGTPVVVFRQDGSNQTPVSWTWTGNYDLDSFGVGVLNLSSKTYSQIAYLTDVIVFNRALSDAEVAEWEVYLATRRHFTHKIIATGDWLVIQAKGQSNEVGFCAASADYSFSASETYYMGLDGFVRPMVCRDGDGANDAHAAIAFATPTGPSSHAAMAQRLRELGETRKILFVPCAHISTDTVAWKNNLTASPPVTAGSTDLTGYAKHRTRDALKAPDSSLLILIDQGEANADNGTEAAAWDPDWDLICDEDNTYYAGKFDKAGAHFVAGRLSANISGVGAFDATVRSAQDTWVAARSDALLVQRPDGSCEATPGLHLIGTEQQAYGVLRANAWWAA